jgi:hypothetical protein
VKEKGRRANAENRGRCTWEFEVALGLRALIYSLPYSRVNAWLPLIGARIWYIDFNMSFHNMALTFLTLDLDRYNPCRLYEFSGLALRKLSDLVVPDRVVKIEQSGLEIQKDYSDSHRLAGTVSCSSAKYHANAVNST